MTTTGDRIAISRLKRNMTQEEVARLTGTSRQTICRYEMGIIKNIPDEKMLALAKALQVTPAYLRGYSDSTPAITEDVVRLPVLGEVAAGYEHMAIENWEGESIEIPRSFLKGHPVEDYFMLRVQGDSMYPLYLNGDIVLVLKQATLNRSGDVGVIRYDGDNATLKRVEYVMGEDWMRLVPINPEYAPRMIENEDLELCEVLGVPRMVIREL